MGRKSILAGVMMLSLVLPFAGGRTVMAEEGEDLLSVSDAEVTELTVTIDEEELAVTWYADCYLAEPTQPENQRINIYIPETADADSPILFLVNNSGWKSDTYPTTTVTNGGKYHSDSETGQRDAALSRGFVVVSYGCRSRADEAGEDGYLGHSPATVTDTKAAIRYLCYNGETLGLNTDRIVITGTSGGGALSAVIAASGNSSDYYESLYEIGAAGIVANEDGTYASLEGCGDEVFAVMAYCPITDFRGADMAYEWLYYDTRVRMVEAGEMSYEGITEEELLDYSLQLKEEYTEYFNGLGLTDENGEALTTENLLEHIAARMEAEFDTTIQEYTEAYGDVDAAVAKMVEEIEKTAGYKKVGNSWLLFEQDEDGKYTGEYSYDIAEHLYYLANNQELKVVNAFSNQGLPWGTENEDNLFGAAEEAYSPFEYLSWQFDTIENGVGYDDTGLTWEEYMETEEGQKLSMQLRMTSALEYLIDSDDVDTAPYWYVRHGVIDRDTSFAVESALFDSILGNDSVSVSDANLKFAWLQPHLGDYDVQEAYGWLDGVIAENQ